MDHVVLRALRWILDQRPVARAVYEIGSRDVNGSARLLFHGGTTRYHGIDLLPGPGVDAVADGVTYAPPFDPDCVICFEVLEHTPAAQALVAHMGRVVAPGGSVVISCAGPGREPQSAVTGALGLAEGEHYANVPVADIVGWLRAAGLVALGWMTLDWDGTENAVPGPREIFVYATGVKPA